MQSLSRGIRLLAISAVLITLFATTFTVSAALDGVILGYSLNAAGCYVDITAQVEDAGFYAINMWDDGNFRAGDGANVPAGGTITVRFGIGGLILQGAAGIGVYLEDLVGPSATTTYDADGSAQLWDDTVGQACADAGTPWTGTVVSVAGAGQACPFPLPVGSVVYNVPAGALAYFAADASTYTGFNLPPGTWYISEFGEEFAKVWIACSARPIWIPVENVVR